MADYSFFGTPEAPTGLETIGTGVDLFADAMESSIRDIAIKGAELHQSTKETIDSYLPAPAVSTLRKLEETLNDPTINKALEYGFPMAGVAEESSLAMSKAAKLLRAREQGYLTYGELRRAAEAQGARLPRFDQVERFRRQNELKHSGMRMHFEGHPIYGEKSPILWAEDDAMVPFFHGTGAPDIEGFDPSYLGVTTEASSAKKANFASTLSDDANGYAVGPPLSPRANRAHRDIDNLWAEKDYHLDRMLSREDEVKNSFLKAHSYSDWLRQKDDILNADPIYRDAIAAKGRALNERQLLLQDPILAEPASPNVLPLYVRPGNTRIVDMRGEGYGTISRELEMSKDAGKDSTLFWNISDPNRGAIHFASADPSRFRSPWARFDPAKIDSSDLLASLAVPIAFTEYDPTGQTAY